VRAHVATRRPGQPGGRLSHQARARARPGEHAPAVGRKKGERGKGKGDWQGCPTRHREKRENALVGLMGCGHGLAGLEALGRLPGL
jgi:hypothetical protein